MTEGPSLTDIRVYDEFDEIGEGFMGGLKGVTSEQIWMIERSRWTEIPLTGNHKAAIADSRYR